MKTLFQKNNKLFIRTSEGEWEVSNPENVKFLRYDNGIWWILRDAYESRFYQGFEVEWPGEFEKVSACTCQVKPMFCFADCGEDKTVKVRLLPKEEKKDPTPLYDMQVAMGHVKPVESSEPQETGEVCPQCGDRAHPVIRGPITRWYCHNRQCPNCDPASNDTKGVTHESQEELWKELGLKWTQKSIIRKGTNEIIQELSKEFTISRNP